MMKRILTSCVLFWTVASLGGCGYTTERPFTPEVSTIHVEMFSTRDFRRNLEYELTEAVIKRIEMDTDYRVSDKKTADTVLSGEIVQVRQNTMGNDFRTDLPRETSVTFVVSFRWKDQHTGRILAERQRFQVTTTYIPPLGETFSDAGMRGLEGVAEQLVEALESPW
jgi:outer membrane lipopolysaccharide assembly protein LptE/RlpB